MTQVGGDLREELAEALGLPEEEPIRPRVWQREDWAALAGAVAAGVSLVWVVYYRLLPLSGPVGFVLLAYAVFLLVYWLVVREMHGRLAAVDRMVGVVIGTAALALLVPLVLILVYVVIKGLKALNLEFFTETLEFTGGDQTGGGALHAIVGSFEQVGLAVLIAVPLSVATAVFLNEIGGRLARPVRFVVDAMSGVPSIIAGLFVFSFWVSPDGLGQSFSGFAAGMALAVLMLPLMTRTCEEVLRLVPGGLRESALALGAKEWRATMQVVLPTARTGIVTAVILGMARAIGETAPLVLTAFGNKIMNANPFEGAQGSLPLFVLEGIRNPEQVQIDRAWTGALVLILLVLILFVLARFIGSRGVQTRSSRRSKRKAHA